MLTDLDAYRQALIDLYLRLPDTPRRLSRFDLHLVRQLWERPIPLTIIETAFLLASARRAARRPDAMPLGPIRSVHYFLPVIEELLATPVPESYVAYLRRKVALRPTADRSPTTTG
ncbi:MAG: hypothetical protein ACRD9W_24570 [Terriglobia bacterium]